MVKEYIKPERHGLYEALIRKTECDLEGQIFPHQLFAFAQEAATRHALRAPDLQDEKLKKQALVWMISGTSMLFYPERIVFGEKLLSETWSKGVKGIKFMRGHAFYRETYSQEGLFALASSDWFLVDYFTRKPARPLEVTSEENLASWSAPFEPYDFRAKRVRSILDGERQAALKGEKPTDFVTKEKKADYSLLDDNRHVNNIHYVAFCIDTLVEYLQEKGHSFTDYSLLEVHVNYVAEVLPGNVLIIAMEEDRGNPEPLLADYGKLAVLSDQSNCISFLFEGWNVTKEESAFRAELVVERKK